MDDMQLEALGTEVAAQQLQPQAEATPATPEQATTQPEQQAPSETPANSAPEPTVEGEPTEQPPLAAGAEPPEDLEVPLLDYASDVREVSDEEHAQAELKLEEAFKIADEDERNKAIWDAVRHTKRGRAFENYAKAGRSISGVLELDNLSKEQIDTKLAEFRMAQNALDWSKQDVYGLVDPRDPAFAEGKQRFFDFWFGPAKDDPQARAGVERTLDYLPEALWKIEPALYVRTRNGFLNEYVQTLYSQADKMPDGDQRNQKLALAEHLDLSVTGKYRGMGQAQPTNGAPNPPTNGFQNGHSPELLRQLEDARRENQMLRSGQVESQSGAIESQIDQKLESVAQDALLGNDGSRAWWESQPPFVQRSILQELRTGMRREVEADPHFMDRHNLEKRNTLRSADPQDAARLVERYARSAAQVLRAKVWPEVAKGLRKQNTDTRALTDKRRNTLQAAQSATAPNGAGAPVPGAVAKPFVRGPNESMDAFSERVATAVLA